MVFQVLVATLLGIALLRVQSGAAFTAYNCSASSGATTVALDMLHVPESCSASRRRGLPEPTQEKLVRILAKTSTPREAGFYCKAKVTRRVTRCGFDGMSYGSRLAEADVDIPLTQEDCRQMRDEKRWKFEGVEFNLQNGDPVTVTYFSKGVVHPHGGCRGEWYFERRGTGYKNSAEETVVTVTASPFSGFPDPAGTRGAGTVLLEESTSCLESFESIYEGAASLHGISQDLLVVPKNGDNPLGAVQLNLLGKERHCGVELAVTHLGHVFVQLSAANETVPGAEAEGFANPGWRAPGWWIDQRQLLHTLLGSEATAGLEGLQTEVCRLGQQLRAAALVLAAGGTNPLAVRNFFGPGVGIRMAGRVAYLTQCVPVNVSLHNLPGCTREIPVKTTHEDAIVYADPFTLVISEHSNDVHCSAETPVAWELDNQWYCSSGEETSFCSPPQGTLEKAWNDSSRAASQQQPNGG